MKPQLHLFYMSLLCILLLPDKGIAQVALNQDFENYDYDWEGFDFWDTDYLPCEGEYAFVTNLYSGLFGQPESETVSPSLGTSNGYQATLTYDYKITNYDDDAPTSNSSDWGFFSVYYGTSASGPFTLLETIDTNNHVESGTCATRTINFFPPAGEEVYIRIYAELGNPDNDFYIYFDNLTAVQPVPPACTGTPAGSATVASTTAACINMPVTLSLQPAYNLTGLEFQWQSSSDGINFTDIATGGEGSTYSAIQSSATWYRAQISCEAGGDMVTSTPVLVGSTGQMCYCNVSFTDDVEPITLVNFAGINNISGAEVNESPEMEDFTNITPASVIRGQSYPITLKGNTNGTTFQTFFKVYFDFNHDGDFEDANESFNAGSVTGSTGEDALQAVTNITIPATATPGLTRMRVFKLYSIYPDSPCGSDFDFGQVEDYNVMVYTASVLDYYNLQSPATATIMAGETQTVYAQAWEPGVTPGAGAGAGITAWIGISEQNTNPNTWTTWIPATINPAQNDNNDEYMANIGEGLEPGTYYYASRFQYDGGVYTYGGFPTGAWNGTTNVSGVLTVICNTLAPAIEQSTQTLCAGSTTADIAIESEEGATLLWYTSATGGTALTAGTQLEDGTVYYAAQMPEGGCESVERSPVTINLNTVDQPVVTNTAFCGDAQIEDIDVEHEGELVWYDAESGGNVLGEDTALENGMVLYVSQIVDSCESVERALVTISLNTVDHPFVENISAFCGDAEIQDIDVEHEGELVWYDAESEGNVLGDDTELEDGMVLYVSQIIDGCESPRSTITVHITVTPAPEVENQVINVEEGEEATIGDIVITPAADATVTWYLNEEDAEEGEGALEAGYVLPEGTTTLYVTQTIDDCSSEPEEVTLDVLLGNEGFDMATFRYYPNPTNSVLNLSYGKAITSVEIYNLVGQQVLRQDIGTTEARIDMTALARGSYMIKVISDNQYKVLKIVKN